MEPPTRDGAPAPPPEPQPESRPADASSRRDHSVALLLAVAAIFAAILATRASFLTGEASGSWQRALRDEVKRSAATIEDVRYTYSVEGSIAFFIAVAQVREQEFRAEAGRRTGEQQELLLYEAGVQQSLVEALLPASEIASNARYALPDGGFDLIARLADQRQLNADLLAIDPDAEQAVGDRASSKGLMLVALGVPVGLSLFLGALAKAFARYRRPLVIGGSVSLAFAMMAAVGVELIA